MGGWSHGGVAVVAMGGWLWLHGGGLWLPGGGGYGCMRVQEGAACVHAGHPAVWAAQPPAPPCKHRTRAWWYVTIIAACATGWLEPFKVAYLPEQCWCAV